METKINISKFTAESYMMTEDKSVFIANLLGLFSINQLSEEMELHIHSLIVSTL